MTARWKQWVLNPDHKAVLSFSGGKDSTAMYLLALEQGVDFLPVFADTGHEHDLTYDYVRNISRLTGGPEIKWIFRRRLPASACSSRATPGRAAGTGGKSAGRTKPNAGPYRCCTQAVFPSSTFVC